MTPPHRRVESRRVKMLLEIEGHNVARLFANTFHGGLLEEVIARACPFSWQEGTRAGSQVREGVATGLRCVGMEVKVFGIKLTSVGLLLDDGETGDAVKRVGLHSEPGIGDLMIAAGTDPVRTCM